MANPEHLAILEKGVPIWNEWNAKIVSLPRNLFCAADLQHANLKGEQLRGIDFNRANLSFVDLRNAVLTDAVFTLADLTDADLSHTVCTGAEFSMTTSHRTNYYGARLAGSNFWRCHLFRSNFEGSDLRGCRFKEADLSYTNLHGADVQGAEFTAATFGSTNLAYLDLSQTKALETCVHSQPSPIGSSTLTSSKGQIEPQFLKGCGLSDWEVEITRLYQAGLTSSQVTDILYRVATIRDTQPVQYYSSFISYNHADKAFALWLYGRLQESGIRCWLDEKQLLPGDDIYEQVDRGIRLWDKVLLCCSEDSLTSWWVDNEIGNALEKEQKLTKERGRKVQTIIPLNLDNYVFSDGWDSGYRAQVRRRLAANFTGWVTDDVERFEVQIKNLIKALRADESAREVPPPSHF